MGTQRTGQQGSQAWPPDRSDESEAGAMSHIGATMLTTLHCNAILPRSGGRPCTGLVGVLPGKWTKVRRLGKGELARPGYGALFCNNPDCRAKWEVVRESTEARAA